MEAAQKLETTWERGLEEIENATRAVQVRTHSRVMTEGWWIGRLSSESKE